jgi:hypothetical protein
MRLRRKCLFFMVVLLERVRVSGLVSPARKIVVITVFVYTLAATAVAPEEYMTHARLIVLLESMLLLLLLPSPIHCLNLLILFGLPRTNEPAHLLASRFLGLAFAKLDRFGKQIYFCEKL